MITPSSFVISSFGVSYLPVPPIVDVEYNTPGIVFAQFLVENGYASVPGDGQQWPVFISYMPAVGSSTGVPINCLSVFDTSGVMNGRSNRSQKKFEHHGIQIRIRSSSYPVGAARGRSIVKAMDGINWETVVIGSNSYLLQNVSRTSDLIPLGDEPDTSYDLFTINALCTVTEL